MIVARRRRRRRITFVGQWSQSQSAEKSRFLYMLGIVFSISLLLTSHHHYYYYLLFGIEPFMLPNCTKNSKVIIFSFWNKNMKNKSVN